MSEPTDADRPKPKRARSAAKGERPKDAKNSSEEENMTKGSNTQASGEDADTDLTERLVDLLATQENMKSKELASALGVPVLEVRGELLELEKLGIVYRTGQTRGTRWWLG